MRGVSELKSDERLLVGEVRTEGAPLSKYAIGVYVGSEVVFARTLPDHPLSTEELDWVGESVGENVGSSGGVFLVAAPRNDVFLLGVRVRGTAVVRTVRFLATPAKVAAGSARCTYVGSIILRPAADGLDIAIENDLAGAVKRGGVKLEGCELVPALAARVAAAYEPGPTINAPAPQVLPLDLRETSATYPVHGSSATALEQAMRASGLSELSHGDAAAQTEEQLSISHYCRRYADGYALEKASVRLEIKTTLPAWEDRAQASAELTWRWDKLFAALSKHEAGHRQIALDYAEKLRRDLGGLRPAASCEAAQAAANELFSRRVSELNRAQSDYDRETRHGILQGTAF